jgi:hypothetical protein
MSVTKIEVLTHATIFSDFCNLVENWGAGKVTRDVKSIQKFRVFESWREKRLEMALIQISVPARENYRVIKGF